MPKKLTMPIKNYSLALNQLKIPCGDLKRALLEHKFCNLQMYFEEVRKILTTPALKY